MAAKPPTVPNPGPSTTDRAAAERLARHQREAAALRENLRKRKEQARARDAGPTEPVAPKTE